MFLTDYMYWSEKKQYHVWVPAEPIIKNICTHVMNWLFVLSHALLLFSISCRAPEITVPKRPITKEVNVESVDDTPEDQRPLISNVGSIQNYSSTDARDDDLPVHRPGSQTEIVNREV